MGCLANFVSPRKLFESGDLSECDIIEFNRLTYSHFAFHVGDRICVNVGGPNGGISSSLTKNFPKGMKVVQRLEDIAGSDRRYNKVRINNCVLMATTLKFEERPRREAIDKAFEGLRRDPNNRAIIGEAIGYNYNLIGNNCEFFATRCKYRCQGFSMQAANPAMSPTMGTLERLTSAVRDDLADVIHDPDENPIVRGGAAVLYAGETAVGWTAYGVKTTFDTFALGVNGIADFFRK